jgi:hypothetical protein
MTGFAMLENAAGQPRWVDSGRSAGTVKMGGQRTVRCRVSPWSERTWEAYYL